MACLASRQAPGQPAWVLFLFPTLVFLIVLVLYPVLYNAYLSFQGFNYFEGTSRYVGWQQYRQLLQDAVFWRSLWNNIIWTIGGVGGQFWSD